MNLLDLIRRQSIPEPWAEGEKIPWSDEHFSRRMLGEHLSQDHDLASRRSSIIDQHVDWIHRGVLSGRPTKILDLGCGPGLYASRLSRLGHDCAGIDFSPSSIAYAKDQAIREELPCTYLQEDIRTAEYGTAYGLIMLIFGEFNVFSRMDAGTILQKSFAALAEGGIVLLEPHTASAVRESGNRAASWNSAEDGLFSDRPHICLEESFWDAGMGAATERYLIIDALTTDVTRYASSMQAYSDQQYQALLREHGFSDVEFHPSLTGSIEGSQNELVVLIARKGRPDWPIDS